ncbi:potassium channel family protein [Fulvivirgaceae bacterium BMA10]|uniref:Potassium channel family protein n=1 Tax=Splendidivirga corallicola TaxID=3051826 RepID=A0ABT8KJV3_9BACT|nr:potassium channel family protein [Fulvivirgaceae bacterium BMA10]
MNKLSKEQRKEARKKWFYDKRYEFLLISLIFILFESLFFPQEIADKFAGPISLVLFMFSVINLFIRNSKPIRLLMTILSVLMLIPLASRFVLSDDPSNALWPIFYAYFSVYFAIIFVEILRQIFRSGEITFNVILASFCDFLLVGVLGAFAFSTIDLAEPGSFQGINGEVFGNFDNYLYFSYITLTTIGFGDITPITPEAKKAAALFGVFGQFYSIIIVGILISKYVTHSELRKHNKH